MIHVNIDNRDLEPRPARSGVNIVLPGMSPELKGKIGGGAAPAPAPAAPKTSSRYLKIPERYYMSESEELDFTVAEWTPEGSILEMLGRINLYEMAVAAFDAATKMRPTSIIRLSRGAQLLRERGSG